LFDSFLESSVEAWLIHLSSFDKSIRDGFRLLELMGDKNIKQQNPVIKDFERWKGVYDQIVHWYDLADSKSMGIITINGILLSFVTLGFIIRPENLAIFQGGNFSAYLDRLLFSGCYFFCHTCHPGIMAQDT
jgi:hypothetical protein